MPKSIYSVEQERLQALLRQIRLRANMRQEDVATRLKRPQSYVSKYESGERRLDILELREVCQVLGISLIKFANKLEEILQH